MDSLVYVQNIADGSKLGDMRIRGLKIDFKGPDGKAKYCRVEIMCRTEEGIVNFI